LVFSEEFEKEKELIANKFIECMRAINDRIGKDRDEETLRNRRSEQNQEGRAKLQDQLRYEYGSAARAFENDIYSEIKQYVESPSEKHSGVRQKYPRFVEWYESVLGDGWEMLSTQGVIEDYGVVEWKSRILEAGFVNIHIRMRNRDLGEYRNDCFVLGYVLDKEFDLARDPIAVTCNEEDVIARYKAAQRFTSRWVVTASAHPSRGAATSSSLPVKDCREWQEGTALRGEGKSGGLPGAKLETTELEIRRLDSLEANRRFDVLGDAARPAPPATRFVPQGTALEINNHANAAAAPPPGTNLLDLLRPEGQPSAVSPLDIAPVAEPANP
jgi:hypothetical protein